MGHAITPWRTTTFLMEQDPAVLVGGFRSSGPPPARRHAPTSLAGCANGPKAICYRIITLLFHFSSYYFTALTTRVVATPHRRSEVRCAGKTASAPRGLQAQHVLRNSKEQREKRRLPVVLGKKKKKVIFLAL